MNTCKRFTITLAVALSWLLSPVAAQTGGGKYALLVGVNNYQHPRLAPLRYAENDALELSRVLRQAGYQVVLLTGSTGKQRPELAPTKENIERQLKMMLQRCRRGDTAIVALAGHGLQFGGQKDCFFCPEDARPFADMTPTLVSMQLVYNQLDASFAGVKVLLVDACRDDPQAARGARGIDADTAPRPPRGVAALFSCAAGQRAFEVDSLKHGVFFKYILDGLKGEARDREGEVTFEGLASYVRGKVARMVPKLIGADAEQSPNMRADLVGLPPVLVGKTVFRPLFNGKDLTGWKTHPDGPGEWRVEDGVLVCSAGRISHLFSEEGDYENFHLRVEAMINDGGNSGVYFRTGFGLPRGNVFPEGYEAQISSTDSDPQRTGGLYNLVSVTEQLVPVDTWFTLEVIATGNRLQVLVDGKKTAEYVDEFNAYTRGHIALQYNNPRTAVRFRKVEIMELSRDGFPAKPRIPQTLFNGENLSGWVVGTGPKEAWRVEKRMLGGRRLADAARGWLMTERDYKQFVLRLDFAYSEGANGGVAIRATPEEDLPLEIQLQDDAHPDHAEVPEKSRSGGLYDLARDREALQGKPLTWNRLEVKLLKDEVWVSVNCRPTLHTKLERFADEVNRFPGLRRTAGRIGLQQNRGAFWFRNITLVEIPEE